MCAVHILHGVCASRINWWWSARCRGYKQAQHSTAHASNTDESQLAIIGSVLFIYRISNIECRKKQTPTPMPTLASNKGTGLLLHFTVYNVHARRVELSPEETVEFSRKSGHGHGIVQLQRQLNSAYSDRTEPGVADTADGERRPRNARRTFYVRFPRALLTKV
jgi:hypothetical protein